MNWKTTQCCHICLDEKKGPKLTKPFYRNNNPYLDPVRALTCTAFVSSRTVIFNFNKKLIATAFESSINHFRIFSFCPAHLLEIILSLLNEQQRNFICYQKGQTKHFMICQKKFQQAMQGKMTNPRSLF